MPDYYNKNKEINLFPDLLVIGAGSAGFSSAITAAEKGANVVIVGEGVIGGTCVNVGCVPSKTMIRAVETLHQANLASRFNGVEADAKITNWKSLVLQKQSLVDDIEVMINMSWKASKFRLKNSIHTKGYGNYGEKKRELLVSLTNIKPKIYENIERQYSLESELKNLKFC